MLAIEAGGYRKHLGYMPDCGGTRVLAVKAQLLDTVNIDHPSTEHSQRYQQRRIHCFPGHNVAVLLVDD